jgi:GTP-binding protein
MQIKNVKFVKGIIGTDDILKSKRGQIAFIGRSNVGKSTLINNITGNKNLVKISRQPGKTKQINFFLADIISNKNSIFKKIYLVDLPGYGYAKIPQRKREKMRKLILWYFISEEANIKKVVLIIDAKVGFKEFDLEMLDVLREYSQKLNYQFIVAVNKIDKLNQKEKHKSTQQILKVLDEKSFVLISAKTGKGINKLLELIF